MKKFLAICLCASLAATAFAGCGKTAASGVEAIKAKGELVMYTDAAFPPFEYVENNEVMGVDADIAKAIADELGVTLKIENVKFDTIVPSVQGGKGDLGVAGITINDERKAAVDFSTPYITSVQYIIVPEASEAKVLEDLAGMEIGVQLGTTSDFVVSDAVNGIEEDDGSHTKGALEGTEAKCIQYANSIEAGQDLLNGRIGAVVADKLPAESIVASTQGLKCFELLYSDGSKTDESYGIAVAKGSDLLEVVNNVIKKLTDDGKIDEFVLAHTGE